MVCTIFRLFLIIERGAVRMNINGVEVDEVKAKRLMKKIVILETDNQAKQAGPSEIARKIKKMIEEEVQCY